MKNKMIKSLAVTMAAAMAVTCLPSTALAAAAPAMTGPASVKAGAKATYKLTNVKKGYRAVVTVTGKGKSYVSPTAKTVSIKGKTASFAIATKSNKAAAVGKTYTVTAKVQKKVKKKWKNVKIVKKATKITYAATTALTVTPAAAQTKYKGTSYTLKATVKPAAAAKATFTSNKKAVATVTSAGKVTAKGPGTATITVKSGTKKVTRKVTVYNKVTGITISGSDHVNVGETAQLTAKVTPASGTKGSVTWKSSDAKIATVSAKGVVTGVAEGDVKITATKDGKSTTKDMHVAEKAVAVTGVALDNTAPKVGETITAVTTPENASNVASYQWYMGTKADAVTNPITGETTNSLKITSAMMDNYIKVVVTDKDGKTYESPVTTEAVTTNELALKSVEDASGGRRDVIIAYFNQPVGNITAADVTIRQVSNDQLFPVYSVSLSSDKLSATIRLNAPDGTSLAALVANTDYNLIIATSGGTASKVFSIPAVADDVVVTNIDTKKKTLTALPTTGNGGTFAAGRTYNIPDDLNIDYNNLVGQTVTIKYDKTNTAMNVSAKAGEQVIYGAFKEVVTSTTNYYLEDQKTETKYYVQASGGSASVPLSYEMDYADLGTETRYGNPANTATTGELGMVDGDKFAYGKLVLNSTGTIKNFVRLSDWSGNLYVSRVQGNSIFGKNNQEQSLENYAIVKDGKTIAISDIAENDVVFYSTTAKLAVVYNDVRTGKIEAVYDNAGFKFAGKDYDASKAGYFSGTTLKTVDTKYLQSLGTEKDITVIFNHANVPVYVLGEQSAIATSSATLVLTKAADGFSQTTSNYLRFVGYNGTEVVTEDVNLADLESLTVSQTVGGTDYKYTFKSTNGKFIPADTTEAAKTPAAATSVDYTTATAGEFLYFIGTASDGASVMNGNAAAAAGNKLPINLATDIPVGQMVSLTKNSKGVVTEISIPLKKDMIVNGNAGATTFDGVANKDFKAGYKSVNTFTISGTTPVYTIAKGPAVSQTTYASFDKNVANANLGTVDYYVDNNNISAVVIDNQNNGAFSDDADGSTTTEYVVKDVKYLDSKISSLSVIKGTSEKTFSKFGSDNSLKTVVAKGDVINVKVLKDGETVSEVNTTTNALATTGIKDRIYGVSTAAPGSFYVQVGATNAEHLAKYTLTDEATIVKIENDAVSVISLSDLKSLTGTKAATASLQVANGDKVDAIVVSSTNATQTLAQTLTDLAAGRGGTGYTNYNASVTTTARYNAVKDAVRDLEVVRDDMAATMTTANYEAATGWGSGTGGSANANGNTIHKTLSDELTRAAKYQIVAVKAMTFNKLAATNGAAYGSAGAAEAAAKAQGIPTSIHATMADGSEKDITITWGTVTAGASDDAVTLAGAPANTDTPQIYLSMTNQALTGNLTVTLTATGAAAAGSPIYAFTNAPTVITGI